MIAALTMLEIDRHYGGIFFDPGEGGAPLLYEHLAYFFFTSVYISVVLFAAGAISEILPTFARKPLFSHRATVGSLVAIGIVVGLELSFFLLAIVLAAILSSIGLSDSLFQWVAAALLVAFGVVRVDAIGLNRKCEPAIGRIGLIQKIAPARLAKHTVSVT